MPMPRRVSVPSGTAPASLEQSQQSATSAQQTLAADERALAQAQASLDADLRKVAVDCRGGNAAESGGSQQGGGSAGACATDAQAVTADRQSVTAATGKVQADQTGALGRGGDAHPGRGFGGNVRAERGVHDAAEGRADRPPRRAAVRDRW